MRPAAQSSEINCKQLIDRGRRSKCKFCRQSNTGVAVDVVLQLCHIGRCQQIGWNDIKRAFCELAPSSKVVLVSEASNVVARTQRIDVYRKRIVLRVASGDWQRSGIAGARVCIKKILGFSKRCGKCTRCRRHNVESSGCKVRPPALVIACAE